MAIRSLSLVHVRALVHVRRVLVALHHRVPRHAERLLDLPRAVLDLITLSKRPHPPRVLVVHIRCAHVEFIRLLVVDRVEVQGVL